MTNHSSVVRGRITAAALALGLLGGVTGCSAAQDAVDSAQQAVDSAQSAVDGLSNAVAGRAIDDVVGRALDQAGVALQGSLSCKTSLRPDAAQLQLRGSVLCTGRTDSGESVKARFDGTVDATGSCPGTLVVRVGDRTVTELTDADACRLQRLVG